MTPQRIDFKVVSLRVGPLLSLLFSVNGIKDLILLLDIILKWSNVSGYAYHRDVWVFVNLCVNSAHSTLCSGMKALWSM